MSDTERVRLNSPYGCALMLGVSGYRRLPNGATGAVVGGRWGNVLHVSFDPPNDGSMCELPSHWFDRIDD